MKTINVVLTDQENSELRKIRGKRRWREFFQELIKEKKEPKIEEKVTINEQ